MASKSRSNSPRTRAPETSTTEEASEVAIEEDSEEEETTDTEENEDMTTEDPEGTSETDLKAASTAVKKVTWQETAQNVYSPFYLFSKKTQRVQ